MRDYGGGHWSDKERQSDRRRECSKERGKESVSFTNERGGGGQYVFRREKRIMYILGEAFYRTSVA